MYNITTGVDIDAVRNKVPDMDDIYYDRASVADIAVNVYDSDELVCMMYMTSTGDTADANVIWKSDIYGLMCAMIYLRDTSKVYAVRVAPHKKEDVKMYISMATGYSIRLYNEGVANYVVINIKKTYEKVCSIFEKVVVCQE